MALSTYLNWDNISLQALNQEMSTSELAPPPNQLLPYHESFSLANTAFFDSYTDPELYHQLPPYDYDPLIHNLLPCPKRQRYCSCDYQNHHLLQEHCSSSFDFVSANFFDGFSPNPNCSLSSKEVLPELLFSAVPEFKLPALPLPENYEECEKKGINERTVSPQSIAARARRRKITEKTQELGKLIPNGNNMNTAEMFSAAAKYVKFLQAQVDMLQLINVLEEEDKDDATGNEDLKVLLGSTSVQEKMYLEEKCFVPKQFVTTLTNDPQLKSKPSILKDLNQLIAKNI
ncbi:hypothetical protein L6164_018125 [Bauhinia variegata]|uniref:Uncharacterized protein n=1 Tax=Bauhinia variegata TaxID=167791 RepID=A0ACB9NA72_BAUVA|nr:hypothetical protein L6164_018125 [Bauhinia variegata]